ncbi:MAG: hypothetical protein K940chlam3_00395 [Chlamydiae bacterium]|nr:hypothetical protein [Chlamydiota bacterium]
MLIQFLNQKFEHLNENFDHFCHQGGIESAGVAVGGVAMAIFQSPYIIPFCGVLIGISCTTLAVKVLSQYNLHSINPSSAVAYQLFHKYPKLRMITLIFSVVIAGSYPFLALVTSLGLGLILGIELTEAGSLRKPPGLTYFDWVKKILCLS